MKVCDAIAQWLSERGITHAFGIVGGGNVALWDAISRLGRTELICNHHEQASCMAASAYYRVCGRPALALVTTGAGSTNAITGVVAAHMDSTPLIVISGNEASDHLKWGTRVLGVQGYDSSGVAEKFTKDSFRIKADNWKAINVAYDLALRPRMGPVWVDVPKDVQVATA